jgi:hypothetical protein
MNDDGTISFGDIENHFSGNAKRAPALSSKASVSPEQKAKDAEALTILQKELATAQADREAAKQDLTNPDPKKATKAQAQLERLEGDVLSLSREISRVTGEPADKIASAPAPVASSPGEINAGDIKDVFVTPPSQGDSSGTVAKLGAAAGAAYGALRNSPDTGVVIRRMENMYGLPPGSLTDVFTTQRPSGPISTREAAQAVAQRAAATTPPVQTVQIAPPVQAAPVESPLPTANNRIGPGQGASAIFNYAIEHGLSPIQAAQAVDNTKQTGGVHDLLQQSREGALKARSMFPAGTTTLPEAPSIQVPSITQSSPRFDIDSSYQRLKHFPANVKPVAALSNPALLPQVPVPAAPVGAIPTAAAAPQAAAPQPAAAPQSPLGDTLETAANRARMAQRGVQIGQGALGGMATLWQAYQMMKEKARGIAPTWEEYLSLAGGPAMTYGGKFLGPVGTVAQLPYAYKKFMEENPSGQVDLGQYLPESMRAPAAK